MATLRELLTEVMGLAKVPVSDTDFISNFNRAMDDLQNKYDTAKRVVKRTVECTDVREEYPLTAGCIGLQRICNSNGYNTSNFTVQDNNIIFDASGIYYVYEKLPHAHITSMDAVPTINSAYHYSMAKYIASKLSADPNKAKELMEDYVLESMQMDSNLKRNANPSRRIKAPLWR